MRDVSEDAYDRSGHWGEEVTRTKIVRRAYWPKLSDDVRHYVGGCKACAKPIARSYRTPERSIVTTRLFELMGMDFIGPMPETSRGNRYILHLVEYFSSYSIAFVTVGAPAGEVVTCLNAVTVIFPQVDRFYFDPGHHFKN